MKDILQRSLDQQAEQALLGEEGAHIQRDGITILEAHARTINRLIDRERENTAWVQQGTAVPCVWSVDDSPITT